jgi:ubiquinol-cytochrome c reductase cytochrome b subunit
VTRAVAAAIEWLDDRTGFRAIRRHLLDERLPAGTGWWFTLGSVLLFGLGIQVVSGIGLALYYAPTPDHAWDSVRFISTQVRAGAFLRGLHYWGASIVVIAAVAHLIRVVLFGSYRKPREANWIVGVLLLHVILAFGLTGYLLPWDQRAYWATVVTINVSKLTPVAGAWVASLLRGGPDIGALTLTRWYAAHVLMLPPLLVVLILAHLYLMRRHGISGPISSVGRDRHRATAAPREDSESASAGAAARGSGAPRAPINNGTFPFFPDQAARDLTMALGVAVILALLAWKGAPALEAPADPASSDYIPRPEWYFLGLFQLLKYFPGRLEVIGALAVPGIVVTLLVLLPWLERSPGREWHGRRVLLGAFAVGLAAVIALTAIGATDRPAPRNGQWNLREVAGLTLMNTGDRCLRCHKAEGGIAGPIEPGRISKPQTWLAAHIIDPEMIGPGVREPPESDEHDNQGIVAALARFRAAPPPAIDPSIASLAVLLNHHCLRCHLIDGVGGDKGPELSHVGKKLDAATIERRIVEPKDLKPDSDMPAFGDKLTRVEIASLARYLAARK